MRLRAIPDNRLLEAGIEGFEAEDDTAFLLAEEDTAFALAEEVLFNFGSQFQRARLRSVVKWDQTAHLPSQSFTLVDPSDLGAVHRLCSLGRSKGNAW